MGISKVIHCIQVLCEIKNFRGILENAISISSCTKTIAAIQSDTYMGSNVGGVRLHRMTGKILIPCEKVVANEAKILYVGINRGGY